MISFGSVSILKFITIFPSIFKMSTFQDTFFCSFQALYASPKVKSNWIFIFYTVLRLMFFIKHFFSKCEQLCKKLQIFPYLVKTFLSEIFFCENLQKKEIFIFCAILIILKIRALQVKLFKELQRGYALTHWFLLDRYLTKFSIFYKFC